MCFSVQTLTGFKFAVTDSGFIVFLYPQPPLIVDSLRAGTAPVLLTSVSPNAWHIVGIYDHLLKE